MLELTVEKPSNDNTDSAANQDTMMCLEFHVISRVTGFLAKTESRRSNGGHYMAAIILAYQQQSSRALP
jgi:hypothetical protein